MLRSSEAAAPQRRCELASIKRGLFRFRKGRRPPGVAALSERKTAGGSTERSEVAGIQGGAAPLAAGGRPRRSRAGIT